MPAGLWGRAQSALTVVRSLAQALAPLVFGGVSQLIAGIFPSQAPIGTHVHAPPSHTTTGLEVTFLVMLVALVAAGWILFRARGDVRLGRRHRGGLGAGTTRLAARRSRASAA